MRSYLFFLPDAIDFSLQDTTSKRPVHALLFAAREGTRRQEPRRARTGAEARYFAAQAAAVYHRTAVDLDEESRHFYVTHILIQGLMRKG
jgi:hypothetical protein